MNSCESEFKPVTFKTTSIDNAYEADVSVTFDKATGNDELSKTINFKIEEAIISTLSDPTKKTSLESILKDFNSEYINFKNDFPDASEPKWELYIETEKTYQSEDIITLAINTYEFKGGAHGNDKIKFLNLNAKTGDVLTKDDLIKDINAFKTLAKTHFEKSLSKEQKELEMEDFFFGKAFQLPKNIGFSDGGFVLLYNVYEIASYNQGYTEFVIPFDEVSSLLKFN
ncbi:DUF3298 and DUF4163 domain-containing protein [Winogradskyella luteola]|uniref:DUF4163 domain-containing protein n=1 Tax=Winogradskyella luteola TaxID=2828330 RepID=A0A9X1F969_9FLAO|nr:DUF3298 and DUF4163 domain-containing protein [Winogradskyella luteola]MBV7268728.1 DUF4163 domain-containing protein [Winogradskyella luteola]